MKRKRCARKLRRPTRLCAKRSRKAKACCLHQPRNERRNAVFSPDFTPSATVLPASLSSSGSGEPLHAGGKKPVCTAKISKMRGQNPQHAIFCQALGGNAQLISVDRQQFETGIGG